MSPPGSSSLDPDRDIDELSDDEVDPPFFPELYEHLAGPSESAGDAPPLENVSAEQQTPADLPGQPEPGRTRSADAPPEGETRPAQRQRLGDADPFSHCPQRTWLFRRRCSNSLSQPMLLPMLQVGLLGLIQLLELWLKSGLQLRELWLKFLALSERL